MSSALSEATSTTTLAAKAIPAEVESAGGGRMGDVTPDQESPSIRRTSA
jgi:hypothetical protein